MKTKNNYAVIITTSAIALLPILLSAIIYSDLPEQIALQWGAGENAQNFAPKSFAAFGVPLLLTALNIITKLLMYNDPKRANVSQKMGGIITWIIPVISLVTVPAVLFIAMGAEIPMTLIVPLFVGILFILMGNYLPKNRQNFYVGYKTPWALADADNWNKTHRLAGYLWIIGGAVMIAQAFVGFESIGWVVLSAIVLVLVVLAPLIYSFVLYKKSAGGQKLGGE